MENMIKINFVECSDQMIKSTCCAQIVKFG